MPRFRVIVVVLLIAVGNLAPGVVSASTTLPDKNETELIRQALVAAGAKPGNAETELKIAGIQAVLDEAVGRVGNGKLTYRRAYKLHRVLHRHYLETYDLAVDDLGRLAEDGTFNCLSAVLFFGLAAERLGFESRIIEYPGHLLLELDVRGGPVLIETTSPVGFDVQPSRLLSYGRASSFGRAWLVMPPEAAWRVPLPTAVGFTWLNRAWRTFEIGNVDESVGFVERAVERVPGLAERVDAVPRLLTRAFTTEYEAGRFEAAYRVATLEARLTPGKVTTQDRVLAAAQKRIESACADGRPEIAGQIREELDDFWFEPVALGLFDRTVNPVIVSAAVRAGNWALAERQLQRYEAAEPDPVLGRRLRDWVTGRRDDSDPVCIDSPRPIAMGPVP